MAEQPETQLTTAAAIIKSRPPIPNPRTWSLTRTLKFSVAMEFTVTGLLTVLLGYLTFEVLYYYESIGRGARGHAGHGDRQDRRRTGRL